MPSLGDQLPSEGSLGNKPKPRKSKAVNVVMDPVNIKGMKVSVATIAFGACA